MFLLKKKKVVNMESPTNLQELIWTKWTWVFKAELFQVKLYPDGSLQNSAEDLLNWRLVD